MLDQLLHRWRALGLAFPLVLTACATSTTGPIGSAPAASPGDTPPAASVAPSERPDPNAQLDARTTVEWSLPGGPDLPTEAFGSIWVVAPDQDVLTIHRIHPETNEVTASVDLPGRRCQQFGVSPEGVWACAGDALVRIDPADNSLAERIEAPLASTFARMVHGAGSLWAFSSSAVAPDTILRIDPATGSVAAIPLGHAAGSMSFGAGALWVTSPADDLLLRVDPASNAVEPWAEELDGALGVAAAEDAVWVALHGDAHPNVEVGRPTVARVDPVDGTVVAQIDTGGSLGDSGELSASAGAVWARAAEPFLVRIDPVTNSVVDRIDATKGGGGVTQAFGSVWATSYEFNTVWRLQPGS